MEQSFFEITFDGYYRVFFWLWSMSQKWKPGYGYSGKYKLSGNALNPEQYQARLASLKVC